MPNCRTTSWCDCCPIWISWLSETMLNSRLCVTGFVAQAARRRSEGMSARRMIRGLCKEIAFTIAADAAPLRSLSRSVGSAVVDRRGDPGDALAQPAPAIDLLRLHHHPRVDGNGDRQLALGSQRPLRGPPLRESAERRRHPLHPARPDHGGNL